MSDAAALDARLQSMVMSDDSDTSSGSSESKRRHDGNTKMASSSCSPAHPSTASCDAPEDEFDAVVDPSCELLDTDQVSSVLAMITSKMREQQGEMLYEVNSMAEQRVHDAAIQVLEGLASSQSAAVTVLRTRSTGTDPDVRMVSDVLIRRLPEEEFCEVRVACVGNVDSGKSTLLGVLTRGGLDDGRGSARGAVFRHAHEAQSGRTSSISQDIVGFNEHGSIVNYEFDRTPSWSAICKSSSKVVTFIDLAGHERYLRTTLFGLTGHQPDFCQMSVGANMGVVGMTKEHMSIALALKVPVYMVVTKTDICPPNVLKRTLRQMSKMIKSPGARKVPIIVKTMDDVILAAKTFRSQRICPIFLVSNVTGDNLDLLRAFINLLPVRSGWDSLAEEPSEIQIDDTFSVPGVGTVVSGTVLAGTVHAGDELLLGPNEFGQFTPVTIKSIEIKRYGVPAARAGHGAAFALKKVKRSSIRKGMRLLHPDLHPRATWEFEAEILVLYHATTISKDYEAVVHCGSTRQVAKIVHIIPDSAADAVQTPGAPDAPDAPDASGAPDTTDTADVPQGAQPQPADVDADVDAAQPALITKDKRDAAKYKRKKKANPAKARKAKIKSDNLCADNILRTGMKARVIFRFMYSPEYVKENARLIFRDGRTKGVGKVLAIHPQGYGEHGMATSNFDDLGLTVTGGRKARRRKRRVRH